MAMSIYNEKNYLFNTDTLDTFQRMYDKNSERWKAEKSVFKDTLDKYDEFIYEVAKLLHELGYSSALECSLLISYLIDSGALSNDFIFMSKSPDPKKEISYKLGTSIVKGSGCCRNYANMHKDIFEVLQLPSDNFYCYQGLILKTGFNKPANHVINLISHEENIYGIDLYNGNRLYHFSKPLVMSEVSTKTNRKLLYKPYYEITIGESDLENIKRRLKRFQDYSERGIINPFVYEDEIKYDAKRKINDSYDTLYDFHQKTKTLKREISHDIRRVYK